MRFPDMIGLQPAGTRFGHEPDKAAMELVRYLRWLAEAVEHGAAAPGIAESRDKVAIQATEYRRQTSVDEFPQETITLTFVHYAQAVQVAHAAE